MPERRVAVIDAVRTPIGRYGGVLAPVRPDDLAALVIRAIVDRTGIDPELIDEIYFGAANQAGEDNRNVARMAALLAGLPETVPGATVNRLCASGREAVNVAARFIEAGHGDVMLAGGVESMSRAPFVLAKSETAWGRTPEIHDTTIGWRFTNPRLAELHHPYSMGETAENVARKWGVSREEQDRFAAWSQQKWAAAKELGLFDAEIVPVEVPRRKQDPLVVDTDEHPRPETTIEALAKLRPAFSREGAAPGTAGTAATLPTWAGALGGSLFGWFVGFGIIWAIRLLGTVGFGKEAMGLGDAYLLGAVGAVLGWADVVIIFFLAPFFGILGAIIQRLLVPIVDRNAAAEPTAQAGDASARDDPGPWWRMPLPYGPWLALATVVVMFGDHWLGRFFTALLQIPVHLP